MVTHTVRLSISKAMNTLPLNRKRFFGQRDCSAYCHFPFVRSADRPLDSIICRSSENATGNIFQIFLLYCVEKRYLSISYQRKLCVIFSAVLCTEFVRAVRAAQCCIRIFPETLRIHHNTQFPDQPVCKSHQNQRSGIKALDH